MKEGDLIKRVQLQLSAAGARLFRNNTGVGYIGHVIKRTASIVSLQEWRPLRAGLIKGSSDLIGWTSVEITEEMIGQRVAVFTAIETKVGRNGATKEQQTFIKNVKEAGGFAGVARSEQEAAAIIHK